MKQLEITVKSVEIAKPGTSYVAFFNFEVKFGLVEIDVFHCPLGRGKQGEWVLYQPSVKANNNKYYRPITIGQELWAKISAVVIDEALKTYNVGSWKS